MKNELVSKLTNILELSRIDTLEENKSHYEQLESLIFQLENNYTDDPETGLLWPLEIAGILMVVSSIDSELTPNANNTKVMNELQELNYEYSGYYDDVWL